MVRNPSGAYRPQTPNSGIRAHGITYIQIRTMNNRTCPRDSLPSSGLAIVLKSKTNLEVNFEEILENGKCHLLNYLYLS